MKRYWIMWRNKGQKRWTYHGWNPHDGFSTKRQAEKAIMKTPGFEYKVVARSRKPY